MLDWISQNKQWLFSGVGVTAVVVIGGLLLRAFRRPRALTPAAPRPAFPPLPRPPLPRPSTPQAPMSTVLTPRTGNYSKPTPTEISKQINALPPYQQNAAQEAYKGLSVRWPALLLSISEGGANKWRVMLKYDDSSSRGDAVILCRDVDIETCPRLKFAQAGTRLDVSGIILNVEHGVTLNDVTIEFRD